MVALDELHRVLTVLAMVRELLTEFPGDATLIAIRNDLVAQARGTHTP